MVLSAKTMNGALRRKLRDEGRPDNVETYAAAVVEALGEVASTNGIVTVQELEQRAEAWRSAYTAHGNAEQTKTQTACCESTSQKARICRYIVKQS